MKTQNVEVLRSFLYEGEPQPVERVLTLPENLAKELRSSNKVKYTDKAATPLEADKDRAARRAPGPGAAKPVKVGGVVDAATGGPALGQAIETAPTDGVNRDGAGRNTDQAALRASADKAGEKTGADKGASGAHAGAQATTHAATQSGDEKSAHAAASKGGK